MLRLIQIPKLSWPRLLRFLHLHKEVPMNKKVVERLTVPELSPCEATGSVSIATKFSITFVVGPFGLRLRTRPSRFGSLWQPSSSKSVKTGMSMPMSKTATRLKRPSSYDFDTLQRNKYPDERKCGLRILKRSISCVPIPQTLLPCWESQTDATSLRH